LQLGALTLFAKEEREIIVVLCQNQSKTKVIKVLLHIYIYIYIDYKIVAFEAKKGFIYNLSHDDKKTLALPRHGFLRCVNYIRPKFLN